MLVDIWKSASTQYSRDKVTLRTTCTTNVKFRFFKTGTGFQHVGYLCNRENGPAQNFLYPI